jgi:hypothetical protein
MTVFGVIMGLAVLSASLLLSGDWQTSASFYNAGTKLELEKAYTTAFLKSAVLACQAEVDGQLFRQVSYSADTDIPTLLASLCVEGIDQMGFVSPISVTLNYERVSVSPSGSSLRFEVEMSLRASMDNKSEYVTSVLSDFACPSPILLGQEEVLKAEAELIQQLQNTSGSIQADLNYSTQVGGGTGNLMQTVYLHGDSADYIITLTQLSGFCTSPSSETISLYSEGTFQLLASTGSRGAGGPSFGRIS